MDHSDQITHKMVLRVLVLQYRKDAKRAEGIANTETEMRGYSIRKIKPVKHEWFQLKI